MRRCITHGAELRGGGHNNINSNNVIWCAAFQRGLDSTHRVGVCTSWYSERRCHNNDLTALEWSSWSVTQPEARSSMTLGVSKGSGPQRGVRTPRQHSNEVNNSDFCSSCFCWKVNGTFLLTYRVQPVSLTLKHLSRSALKDSLYHD